MGSTDEPVDGESLAAGDDPTWAASSPLDPAEVSRLQRNMWRFVLGSMAGVLAAIGVAGFFVKTDYVALVPGSTRDTEPILSVEGIEAYPSEGEIHYTTVRLVQNPSVWEYLWYSVDDDAELIEQQQVLGDRSVEENREYNLQLMTSSKDLAVAVALEVLGYETIVENGVIVAQVLEGTAADGVVVYGDIIVSIDGQPITMASEVVDLIGTKSPGDDITLVLDDGTSERTVTVTLGAKDDDPEAPFLGIAPMSLLEPTDLDLGFDVEIDSASVGGPSAGLAFTLAILDDLTPGDLTGGHDVAVTGTIESTGYVGAVGGVEQKVVAVREAGIDVFIVPTALGEDTLAAVREAGGPEVEVIDVLNVDEALEVLADLGGDIDALSEFALQDHGS